MDLGGGDSGNFALLQAMARALLVPLAVAIPPRLALIFFRYMQPFLIHTVSDFVTQPVTQYTTNQGWGLTAAYGLVYMGIAVRRPPALLASISTSGVAALSARKSVSQCPFTDAHQFSQAIYYHQMYRMITMTRGTLITSIYAKTIELSTT